jgi:hypothetical protein
MTKILAYEVVLGKWNVFSPGGIASWSWTTTDGTDEEGNEIYVSGSKHFYIEPDGSARTETTIRDGIGANGPVVSEKTETIPAGEWILVPGSSFGSRSGTYFIERGTPPPAPEYLVSEEALRRHLAAAGCLPVTAKPLYVASSGHQSTEKTDFFAELTSSKLVKFGAHCSVGVNADGGVWTGGAAYCPRSDLIPIAAFWGVEVLASIAA